MTTGTRHARREKQKRQRQRQPHQRRRSGGITNQFVVGGFVIGAVVLAILGLRAAGVFEPPAVQIDINSAEYQIPSGVTIGTLQPDQGAGHIPTGQNASYNSVPPTSGEHWSSASPAAPAPWGIKDTTLRNEQMVHNLEHGGIVIAYNPSISSAELDQLKGIVRTLMNGTYRKIILQPYPAVTDAKVAVTAWRWLLKLQSVDQIQIVQFVRAHYADPNYAPEPNVQ